MMRDSTSVKTESITLYYCTECQVISKQVEYVDQQDAT